MNLPGRAGSLTASRVGAVLAWILPAAALCAFVVVLGLRAARIIDGLYWYPDLPEAPLLGVAAVHAGGGAGLVLPAQTSIGPLLLDGALATLPVHRILWVLAGPAMAAVAIAFMTRASWLAAGRRIGLLTAVLAVAAPPVVIWESLSPIAHISTVLATAVLAWHLVNESRGHVSRRRSLGVGLLTAVAFLSDPLLLVAGVIPYGLACLLAVVGSPGADRAPRVRSLLLTAIATGVGVAAGRMALTATGIVVAGSLPVRFSGASLGDGISTTVDAVARMISGLWYGQPVPAPVTAVAIALVAAALALPVRRLTVARHSPDRVREPYIAFWWLSAALTVVAFLASGLGSQRGPINYQGHYLDGAYYSMAALVPLLSAGGWWRQSVTSTGVALLTAVSAAGLASLPAEGFLGPDYKDHAQLIAVLDRLHLHRGFGPYWEAYGIGWHTDDRVTVLPVEICGAPSQDRLCQYAYSSRVWFRDQGGKSFLILPSGSLCRAPLPPCAVTEPPAYLGTPVGTASAGELHIFVFDYDVAQRFAPLHD